MNLYTIGFTQKSARTFFELLRQHEVELLVDIRLHNTNQLAGFSKRDDLAYFLAEICGCRYLHCPEYAPEESYLKPYKHGQITWQDFEDAYLATTEKRGLYRQFAERFADYRNVCILCSEAEPDCCHRRLLGEKIHEYDRHVKVIHL